MSSSRVFRVGDLIVSREHPNIRLVVVALRPAENGGGYWVTRDQGSTIRLAPHHIERFKVLARNKQKADALRRIDNKIEDDRRRRQELIASIFEEGK